MPNRNSKNKQAERPTPRSKAQEVGSGGVTGVPSGEQDISNRAGDKDENVEQVEQEDEERRFNNS